MATYKILSFDKNTGSILVQFAENMTPLSIDVPINEAGLFVTGEELEQYIQGFIPTWHIERIEKLRTGVANSDDINTLVAPAAEVVLPVVPEITSEEEANRKMWIELEEEKKVARVLVKFGLLTEDPTVIPTATL
jgi:hypothetical protein